MTAAFDAAAAKTGIILFDPDEYTRTTGNRAPCQVEQHQQVLPFKAPHATASDLKPKPMRNRSSSVSWSARRTSFSSFRRIQVGGVNAQPSALPYPTRQSFRARQDCYSHANTVLVHEDIPMLEEVVEEDVVPRRKMWRLRKLWRKYICGHQS